MRRATRVAVWLTAGAVLTGLIGVPVQAVAPATATPANAVVSEHKITVVTGDVVRLTKFADGRQHAVVDGNAGKSDSWQITEVDGEVHAVPMRAGLQLAHGTLDPELFNLTKLVEQGYDDSRTAELPVMVTYRRQRAARPDGVVSGKNLDVVNGAALKVRKRQGAAFWADVVDDGISGIWLDGKVKATLDESVSQVGAPQAWQRGYDGTGTTVAVLDTGVDGGHPDLSGKVVAERNFTGDADATDRHGHGTHVASTVAGSGAASNGTRKGVAPGAKLLNGKVLDQYGDGSDSGVIAGMEWAVEQGADIVNMSLGGSPTDGKDPLSQAVNRLSARGTLFVVAAGNSGRNETIAAPAAADAALTVAAVDGTDRLASFSSRGPRVGDGGLKPDIAAPGVNIDAAAPRLPDMPTYRSLSGTSMSTPHVAGAAAILLQGRPKWTGQQLKAGLMSSARRNDAARVYDQGAGRLDVAAAVDQQVTVDQGSLDFGLHRWPHDTGDPVIAKTVTYRNTTDQPVELHLAVEGAHGRTQGTVDTRPFTVSPETITVPAGGAANATVRYDRNLGSPDAWGAWVAARHGQTVVHTAVGAIKEGEMYDLRVRVLGHDGQPVASGVAMVWGVDAPSTKRLDLTGEPNAAIRVARGRYSVMASVPILDASGKVAVEYALLGDPEVEVAADAELTLDLRQAKEVTVATPTETEAQGATVTARRSVPGRGLTMSALLDRFVDKVYLSPSEPASTGFFEVYTKWDLHAPPIRATLATPRRAPIQLEYLGVTEDSVKFDGSKTLDVVYAGTGRPADFARLRVRGRIALVSRSDEVALADQLANAKAAGAAAVIVHNDKPGVLNQYVYDSKLPAFWTGQAEGERIRSLLSKGPVKMTLRGVAYSPYTYDVLFAEQGRMPAKPSYRVDNTNAAQTRVRYSGSGVGSPVYGTIRHWTRPYPIAPNWAFVYYTEAASERIEWVSTNQDMTWQQTVTHGDWTRSFTDMVDVDRTYRPGQRLSQNYYGAVLRPGLPDWGTAPEGMLPASRRDGEWLYFPIAPALDATPGHRTLWPDHGGELTSRLYRNGDLFEESYGAFKVPADQATYRLEIDQTRDPNLWALSTNTKTAWTFTSEQTDSPEWLPMLYVDYDLQLDLHNRAPAGRLFGFEVRLRKNAESGPAVRGAKVWTSYDDGTTWTRALLSETNSGRYRVTVLHPPRRKTSGFVSLRVEGIDVQGNKVEQTTRRAYGLR